MLKQHDFCNGWFVGIYCGVVGLGIAFHPGELQFCIIWPCVFIGKHQSCPKFDDLFGHSKRGKQ